MLTRKHLAVLRAALQYFQEELVPHGLVAMRPYLEEALDGDITSADVQSLQQFLRDVDARYVVLDRVDGQSIEITLHGTAEEAISSSSDPSHRLAVVLIPPKS